MDTEKRKELYNLPKDLIFKILLTALDKNKIQIEQLTIDECVELGHKLQEKMVKLNTEYIKNFLLTRPESYFVQKHELEFQKKIIENLESIHYNKALIFMYKNIWVRSISDSDGYHIKMTIEDKILYMKTFDPNGLTVHVDADIANIEQDTDVKKIHLFLKFLLESSLRHDIIRYLRNHQSGF